MTVGDVANRTGDPVRGEARFMGACSTCHRRGASAGAEVGPDLTDIDRKFDRNGLIEAIVTPGAAIALGFGAEVFVTRRSRTTDRISPVRGRDDFDSRRLRPHTDHRSGRSCRRESR